MTEIVNAITDFLKQIEPLLLVLAPAACALYIKLSARLRLKRAAVKRMNDRKTSVILNNWEKYENRKMLQKILEFCNRAKDLSKADQVLFLHLTNGTVTLDRIHAMYIECLVEDSRYSPIPKKSKYLQHVPFTDFLDWDVLIEDRATVSFSDIPTTCQQWIWKDLFRKVNSQIVRKIYDENDTILGYVIFNYVTPKFDGSEEEKEKEVIKSLSTQIETVFHGYVIARNFKLIELGMKAPE